MPIDVWEMNRPDGGARLWACKVSVGAEIVFDSQNVSLRLKSKQAAEWLARQVEKSHLICPVALLEPPVWAGDLNDDCRMMMGNLAAHAEWLSGPRRGGEWYCSVREAGGRVHFHTIDAPGIQPKSGAAARWLCELILRLVVNGILEPVDRIR